MADFIGAAPAAAHAARPHLAWVNPESTPFTPAWYAVHPGAWKITHPYAGAFAVVSVATVVNWLAAPYPYPATTTVVTEGAAVYDQPPGSEETYETSAVEEPAGAEEFDAAQWMPLGVFGLAPAGGVSSTRVVQLAVDRSGVVRGSYYDLVTGTVENVHGSVNKQNLEVSWTIGDAGTASFSTPLAELTKPEGKVSVSFPDGQKAAWLVVQVQE